MTVLSKVAKKGKLSKELSIIFQDTCLQCYNRFDEGAKRPYILYPCQHYYCKQCVEKKVLDQKGGVCPECNCQLETENVKQSQMLLNIIKMFKKVKFIETESQEEMVKFEKQIGTELFKTGFFYACTQCEQPFDRVKRQPNIVCSNQHVVCSECLKKNDFRFCPQCQVKILYELHLSKLVLHASEFIQKVLFTQTVKFVINDKEYCIRTDAQTIIRDIFFKLQNVGILSAYLQIKECHFLVKEQGYKQVQAKKISEFNKIGDKINKIYLEFDQKAQRRGANVTMPSKIVVDLPIKISDFAPISNIKYQVDDDDEDDGFGVQVKPSKSELDQSYYSAFTKKQVQRKKQENNLSKGSFRKIEERSKQEKSRSYYDDSLQYQDERNGSYKPIRFQSQKPARFKIFQNPIFKKDNVVLGPEVKKEYLQVSSLSNYEKSLVKKSSVRSQILQDQRAYIAAVKQSRIDRLKEAPIGTAVPEIFVENYNTKLPRQERGNVLRKFLEKHEVNEQDYQLLCYQVEKAMNKPFTKEEINASNMLEKKIDQQAKKGNTLSMILKILKSDLQDGKIRVVFSPKSTERSKLTLKVITSHYLTDRFIVKESVDDDQQFYFQKLSSSQADFAKYVDLQKNKYANRLGLDKQNIVIHNLVKGSKILIFSTNDVEAITKNIKYNLDKKIEIHPYFTQLELSPDDFDQKGCITFRDKKNDIEFRGNWPYYQPIKSIRYGIKVLNVFDNGSNNWLKMKNEPGEWVVGYHGVKNPNEAYKECKNVIQSILGGLHRQSRQMLINVENSRQAYSYSKCVCHPQQNVGDGVYLSPMFKEALQYSKPYPINENSYRLVFQCRLNPSQIHIPNDKQNYWVMRFSKDIRPYGIILIEENNAFNYPTPQDQFGEKFTYQKYRKRIEGSSYSSLKNISNSTQ